MVGTATDARTTFLGMVASLLMVVCLLVGANVAFAGAPAKNTYTAPLTDAGGTLQPDGSWQTIGTTDVSLTSGGLGVTTFNVTILGTSTVGAGEVTAVDVSDGTNTWSASGAYGPGSVVACAGNATPVDAATITIRIQLAAASAGKTVGVELTSSDSGSDNGLPAAGTLHNIAAGPVDTLSVSLNTPVATTATLGQADVQMQVLQVDSDNGDNGSVVITNVTVDDVGTAVGGDIDFINVYMDNDANFGNGTLAGVANATFSGTQLNIDLAASSISAADRTVSFGTSKYIWITYDVNAGATVSNTLQSRVTAVDVAGGETGASGTWNSNNFAITAAPTDTLSVTLNTPVANAAGPSDIDVQMQVLQVDSDNVGDGSVEITNVTVDDVGTAVGGDIDFITVYMDSDANFGNGTLAGEAQATFSGSQLNIDLAASTISAASRTVSFGTSKYIWITYDMNVGVTDGTQIQSRVTNIAVAGGDSGASGTWNSNNISTSSGPAHTLADCSGCHNTPPVDAGSRDAATGNFVGDHDKHQVYTCATCHALVPASAPPAAPDPADFPHRSGQINMDDGNIGVGGDDGTYSKGANIAQSASPTGGTCSNVECHGGNPSTSPQWGVGNTTCDSCHTLPPATGAHAAHYSAKGWAADETNCTQCHPDNTSGHSDVTDASVTVTRTNMSYSLDSCSGTGIGLGCHNEYATPVWASGTATCTSCHTAGGAKAGDPTSGLHAPTNLLGHDDAFDTDKTCTSCHDATTQSSLHWDGTLDNSVAATYTWNTGLIPAGYDRTNDYCAATCHSDGGSWNREWTGATDVTWAYGNDASTAAVCGNCHGTFATGWNIVGNTSHDNPDVDNDANPGTGDNPDTLATSKNSHSECSSCHGWGHTNYSTGSDHINNTLEMNSTLGYNNANPDATCSTNCHAGQTLTMKSDSGWTDASVVGDGVTCGGCHTGGVTSGSASGAHDAHGATAASVAANPASIALCIECHGNDGTGASHNNGTVNFVGATYSTAVRNDLTGTCSTTSCHNTGTEQSATWNAANLACNDCHYYEASPTAANNSAHDAPLSASHGDHFTAGKSCAQCHGTLPTDTTHINGATSNADKATATQDEAGIDFTDASAVTDYTWTDGSNTCSGGTNNGLGCHATGSPVWDNAFDGTNGTTGCIECHTDTSSAANPVSGLHGVVPSVSGQQHNQSVTGGCTACHASMPVAGTHKDGTFAGDTMGSLGLQYYTQSAADTGTCATTSCHLSESDAWAHKWMATANYTSSTASCTGCHGNLSGWNAGVDHLVGEIASDHADDGTASNYGCENCHALEASTGNYTFTFNTNDWGGSSNHGNNQITMNDGAGPISDWQRGTGGNSGKSMCLKCHTDWNDSAPQHWFTDTTWAFEEVVGDGISAGHGAGANCAGCHDGSVQGTRRDVGLDFNLAYQHGDNTPDSATNCEKCHDEASGPDTNIQLKVYDAAGAVSGTVTFNPSDLSSANSHCISCHDDSRNVTIEGLSPPARSMANFTSATTYKNHNFTTVTGAVVPQKDKAISPHGNPGGNQLKQNESSVSTALGCLHCHPSHGSGTASKTATADATGSAVSARMLGGKPSELAGIGLDYANEGSLSDPDLCWDCHDSVGVADYYGDTTTGHWDGGTWKSPTFSYKTGKGGVNTLHIADKTDGGTASDAAANIVCTTCHDVHGSPTVAQFYSPALKGQWLTSPYYEDRAPPSKANQTNGLRAWSNADSSARSTNDQYAPRAAAESGTAWAPKEVGGGYGVVGAQNGAWGWFIDGNTFGMSAYNAYTDGAVTQRYMSDFDATAGNINTFGGLCMSSCHSAANIESRTSWTGHNPVVPGFGGSDAAADLFNVNGTTINSRQQMVGQGWYNNADWGQNLFATDSPGERQGGDGGAVDARTYSHERAFSFGVNPTAAGAQANYHQFPCAKCHNPHASVLPALMRTNCLNTAQAGYEWRMAAEANNCHRVEDAGAPIQGPRDPYDGVSTGKQWNTITPW